MKHIIAREVTQDYDHSKKITALYGMINEAVKKEFTEDNIPTRQDFCAEMFTRSFETIDDHIAFNFKLYKLTNMKRSQV